MFLAFSSALGRAIRENLIPRFAGGKKFIGRGIRGGRFTREDDAAKR
jgi:hypothetical protein